VGRGTEAATLAALAIDPSETRARFEQHCAVLQAKVAQVPLYIAGSTPETLGFAVARDIPLLLSLEPPETTQLGHVADLLQGRPSTLLQRSSLARYVCIGATAAQVTAQLDGLWAKLQERRNFFSAKRGVPPDQVPRIDPERMLREQFIHGDPAQCHAQIVALQQRSGIGALRCVFKRQRPARQHPSPRRHDALCERGAARASRAGMIPPIFESHTIAKRQDPRHHRHRLPRQRQDHAAAPHPRQRRRQAHRGHRQRVRRTGHRRRDPARCGIGCDDEGNVREGALYELANGCVCCTVRKSSSP
jgi:hypothetical protein